MLLACVQLLTLDLVLCFPVFFMLFLEKTCRCLMVRGRTKVSKSKIIEGVQAQMILQAFTPKALTQADSGEVNCFEDGADSEGECVLFKGKDGHDTDGSLSLGKGKAPGRVDVPVGVNAFLSAETFCRSGQSVALVTPGSCVAKNDFCKREWMGTQWYTGSMSTLLWVTCWISRSMCGSRTLTGSWFNLVTPLVTLVLGIMTHYAAVDGSEEERSVIVHHRLTFQVSGRVKRAGKNGCGL